MLRGVSNSRTFLDGTFLMAPKKCRLHRMVLQALNSNSKLSTTSFYLKQWTFWLGPNIIIPAQQQSSLSKYRLEVKGVSKRKIRLFDYFQLLSASTGLASTRSRRLSQKIVFEHTNTAEQHSKWLIQYCLKAAKTTSVASLSKPKQFFLPFVTGN